MLGERREYLTIKILHNDMTVRVPTENAALAGLRRVIDEETVKKVLDVLRDEVSEMPKNWNRRFKHNRDKIKTGDIYELAEVVRNLSLRENEKGLSTGEKQMFTRTKKILASELMYALDKDEEEAESYLDELLAESASQSDGRGRSRLTRLSRTRQHPRGPIAACANVEGNGRRPDRGRRTRRASRGPTPEGARRAGGTPAGGVEHRRPSPGGWDGEDRPRPAPGHARSCGRDRGGWRSGAFGLGEQSARGR